MTGIRPNRIRQALYWIASAFEREDGKASQNRIAAFLCVLTACALALWKPTEYLTIGTLLAAAFGKLKDRDRPRNPNGSGEMAVTS